MPNQHLVVGPAAQLRALRQQAADLDEKIAAAQFEQQRIAGEIGQLRDAVQARKPDRRVMTDAERAQLTALSTRQKTQRDLLTSLLQEKITVATDLNRRESDNEAARTAPDPGTPQSDVYFSRLAAQRAKLIPGGDPMATSRYPRAWDRSSGVPFFGHQAASDLAGFTSGGEFYYAVAHDLHHPSMRATSQSGNEGSGGGYLIPTAKWNGIVMGVIESSIVMPRAQLFPMTTRELDVPAFDDGDHSSGAFAGLELQMTPESGSVDEQVATFRMLTLRARKGMFLVRFPNELIADAATIEAGVETYMRRVLAFGFDYRFLFGDGSNGPLGCLVAPATITINRDTANKIIYSDLLSMFSRLLPGSVARSVWLANPVCIPELGALGVPVGTAGSHIPVLSNANGEFTILTRPVVFTEKVPTLGTQSDLSLVDLSGYAVGVRQDADLQKSMHVGFATDEQLMRLVARFDGQPILSAAVTPLNGNTLSHFVTLGDPA